MNSVIERLKELGGMMLGLMVVLALASIPLIFLAGSVWSAEHLLQPLIVAGWFAIALDVSRFHWRCDFFIIFRFWCSHMVAEFILTYALWGLGAVVVGILLFGRAVVPYAMLATMLQGMWEPFFTVFVLLLVTFGSRIVGALIAESAG